MLTGHNAIVWLIHNCAVKLYNIAVAQLTKHFSLTKNATCISSFSLTKQVLTVTANLALYPTARCCHLTSLRSIVLPG